MSKNMLPLTLALAASLPAPAMDRISGRPFATRSEVIATNGMVASSHPLATQVAIDILKQGGTAVDAAIAANAVLGVCEPTGCGIGGDLFAIVWDGKTKALHGLNGSGRSPRSLTREWFLQNGHQAIPKYGPLPVSEACASMRVRRQAPGNTYVCWRYLRCPQSARYAKKGRCRETT